MSYFTKTTRAMQAVCTRFKLAAALLTSRPNMADARHNELASVLNH